MSGGLVHGRDGVYRCWGGLVSHSGGMGMDPVVQLHTQVHKLCEVLWLFHLVYQACLEFLGKAWFVGSLVHISVIVQDGYMVLRCSIVLTEFIISLSELVKLSRCSSHLVRVT
jgi:hypothetical protein